MGAPRDPARGTTGRRADLPSDHGAGIAAVVGLLAAIVVLVGAGWLILRSSGGDGGTAGARRTPAASMLPGSSQAPVATGPISATPDPARSPGTGVLPTRRPLASDDPGASPPPATAPPATPAPSASAAPLVADTGFTCEQADFDDPTKGTWRITEAMWGPRDKWDELTIVLERVQGKGATNVSVESMTAREAAQVTGMDEATLPRVLLITFDGDVTRQDPIVALLSERQLRYLNIETTSEATYAIVGVNKDTCRRMVVPAWKNGKATAVGDTVKLLLDVRYR